MLPLQLRRPTLERPLPSREFQPLLLERLTALRDTLGDREPAVVCNWHGIRGLRWACAREEPATALLHAEEAMVIAQAIGHGKYCTLLSSIASMNRWLIGAAEAAERTLVDMRDDDVGMVSSFRPFVLAWLLADRGALGDARGWAERLVASGQAKRLPQDEGRGRWALAEVLRRAGELGAADAEAQAALAMLSATCPIEVPGALATLAAVRLAQGRAAEGAALAEEGLARYPLIELIGPAVPRRDVSHEKGVFAVMGTVRHNGFCWSVIRRPHCMNA
ncbi:uncharacterized protein SOCE26_079210 [Sorangium cellulosum]|uniref:MalT-like TPR region domain-containing protein n=1 Tax=Sorangium cellulosum TaxID=56 RepID=A0A2L0F4B7_SORCE|nr:hypothetical protein [Sorangium cellulosum]AUX46415.1 uncharacterized protein SOCE26_079210 [Sorangium cellulosum]